MSKSKKSTKPKNKKKKTTPKKNDGVYLIDAELGKIDISKPKTKAEAKKRDQEIKRRVNIQKKLHQDKEVAENHPLVIEAKSKVADLDLDKLITPTTLANIAQAQKTLQAYANVHQNTFRQIAEMQENIIRAYTQPLRQLQENLQTIATFQSNIAKIATLYQDVISNTILNSGIHQILNNFSKLQVRAFAGIYIKSELPEEYTESHNGISQVTKVRESSYIAGGQFDVDFQKDTTSPISGQIVYSRMESIDTRLQVVDDNLVTTNDTIASIERRLERSEKLLEIVLEDPWSIFQIKNVKYLKSSSQFVVNSKIKIPIPSMTKLDYLCQVLFSGIKEKLTEEWYWKDIKKQMQSNFGEEEASNVTWKSMQGYVADINIKIAGKTTKDDIILIPRTEIIQLNPVYFQ